MAIHFPILFARDGRGVVSASVAGVPVYAQGATQRQAERAVRQTLRAYLEAHPETSVDVTVKVATIAPGASRRVTIVSAAALLGRRTSRRKAASSRANGRLGGRPRTRRSEAP